MFLLILHPHVVIDDAAGSIDFQLIAKERRKSQLAHQRVGIPGATPRVRVDGGFAGNDMRGESPTPAEQFYALAA